MCKVYNPVGCLTTINSHLLRHEINDFKSLNDIVSFQQSYSSRRVEIISEHQLLINKEKMTLHDEIILIDNSIKLTKSEVEKQIRLNLEKLKNKLENLPIVQTNLIQEFVIYLKKNALKIMILINELSFNYKIEYSVRNSVKILAKKNKRYEYIDSNFSEAVKESSLSHLEKIDRKKRIIDEINNSIVGAFGELKVVEELEYLSDDYILINDFNFSFNKPIYYRKENSYIKSVQIDHILISPSGIFLIETKNWSKDSLNNINLHSPVQQIRRTSLALFKIVSELNINHHWGNRKIPIRNLIVLINQKPIEEFEFVKILTLKQLLGYINYFKPCFSNKETTRIADYLLNKMNTKNKQVITK